MSPRRRTGNQRINRYKRHGATLYSCSRKTKRQNPQRRSNASAWAARGCSWQLQESILRKNLDSPERNQHERVGVAGDNVRRATAQSELEEVVVFRIAAESP